MIRGTFEAIGKYTKGEIDEKMLSEMEITSCPTAGACQGLYSANTMACLTEFMGMSLPYCATSAAVSAKTKRIAFDSGVRINELVEQNIKPSSILTKLIPSSNVTVDNLEESFLSSLFANVYSPIVVTVF